MFPTKNMYDYMTEINRLFPRATENELRMHPQNMVPPNYNTVNLQSPFNSTMGNHSSSSADSISPEFFPHMSPPPRIRVENRSFPGKQTMSETPFPAKRHRAIVGRKIMGNTEHATPAFDSPIQLSPVKTVDSDMMAWQESPTFSQSPPNRQIFVEQKNVFYELFPTERKGFEFRTPVKSSRTSSFSCSTNISPNSTVSVSPVSSNMAPFFSTPPPPYRRNITANFGPGPSRMSQDADAGKICSFCRKNGETPMVYMTHTVKEMVGNRNVVRCPILRSHVCSTCGASGDNAHTITYCPVLRSNNNGRPLQSTTITLKNTRVKSNGRKRY